MHILWNSENKLFGAVLILYFLSSHKRVHCCRPPAATSPRQTATTAAESRGHGRFTNPFEPTASPAESYRTTSVCVVDVVDITSSRIELELTLFARRTILLEVQVHWFIGLLVDTVAVAITSRRLCAGRYTRGRPSCPSQILKSSVSDLSGNKQGEN